MSGGLSLSNVWFTFTIVMKVHKVGILFQCDRQHKKFSCPLSCKKRDVDGDITGEQKFLIMTSFLEHMRIHERNGDMLSCCLVYSKPDKSIC